MDLQQQITANNDKLFIENKELMMDNFAKNGVKYKGTFKFIATSIQQCREGNWLITFECPFCFSKYRKNNEPHKNAKNIDHTHGTDASEMEKGYISGRSSHCHKMEDYIVYIGSKTKVEPYTGPTYKTKR